MSQHIPECKLWGTPRRRQAVGTKGCTCWAIDGTPREYVIHALSGERALLCGFTPTRGTWYTSPHHPDINCVLCLQALALAQARDTKAH